ncbi:hypothetical protein DL98DRAFT_539409 [Cadophora sp. DSE1049]|nr:hypothetical protein DL98DRAFT_539409 [Cadophora sp. DSE1049]
MGSQAHQQFQSLRKVKSEGQMNDVANPTRERLQQEPPTQRITPLIHQQQQTTELPPELSTRESKPPEHTEMRRLEATYFQIQRVSICEKRQNRDRAVSSLYGRVHR